jgi:hypothetical protein
MSVVKIGEVVVKSEEKILMRQNQNTIVWNETQNKVETNKNKEI